MKSYGRATIVGMLWSWLASAGTELLWLPTAMITARLLTPADFGITATASFFLQLAARLTQFGFNAALVKMKEVDDDHASSVFVLNIGMGVFAWLSLALSAPWIAAFFRSPATGEILPIAALSFLVVPLGTVPNALLVRELRYRELTYCLWINTLTSSTVTILLAWAGFGYWSLIYGQLAAAIAQSAAKLVYSGWRPRLRFSRSAARDTFSFGMGIYALRLLEYAALNLDSMAVGRTMGMTTLGFYDKAFNLMSRVLDRLNQAGPSISFRVFAMIQDEQERFRRGYRKIILSSTLLSYPLMTGLALTAAPLFEVMFGKRWVIAAWPFQILCIAGGLKVLNSYAEAVVEAAGRVWAEVWRQAIYAALIVVGVVALTPWGTPGAATAVLFATIVMTGLMHHLVLRGTSLTVRDLLAPQVPAVLGSIGVAAAVLAVQCGLNRVTPGSPALVRLVAASAGGGVFYVAYVLLTPATAVRELRQELLEDVWPAVKQMISRPTIQ